ncbi:hypothetical protein BH09MYX1_BH09MYX1_37590 [soil metagenome]
MQTSERAPNYLTDNYPGDVCDPNAMTTVSPTFTSWTPTGGRKAPCSFETGPGCPAAPPGERPGGCEIARDNVYEASNFIGYQVNNHGLTRPLYCECPEGFGDGECASNFQCIRTQVRDPVGSWLVMHVFDASTNAPLNGGPAGLISSNYPSIGGPSGKGGLLSQASDVSWGWNYVADLNPPPYVPTLDQQNHPGDPHFAVVQRRFEGWAWAWVFQHVDFNLTVPGGTDPTGSDGVQRLRQYFQRVHVDETGPALYPGYPCNVVNRPAILQLSDDYCPMCGGFAFLKVPISDPNPTEHSELLRPGFANRSAKVSPGVVEAFGTSTFVSGTDVTATAGTVRGVFVDGRHLKALVRFDGTGLDTESADLTVPGNGAMTVAVSERRQEVAFFAADDPSVYIYDFDAHTTHIQHIHDGNVWKNPVAATYRPELDEYDVLDVAAGKATLYRVRHGVTVDDVILWNNTTNNFDHFGLTTGPDGSLLLSTWNVDQYNLAVLQTSGEPFSGDPPIAAGVRLVYLSSGQVGSVLVPPVRTLDGILLLLNTPTGFQARRIAPVFSDQKPALVAGLF